MNGSGPYPLIEVALCRDRVYRWQLELLRLLHRDWPGSAGVSWIDGPSRGRTRHRWLSRWVSALELEDAEVLSPWELDENSEPGLLIDLTGTSSTFESVARKACPRAVLYTSAGDLADQPLPFAAEVSARQKKLPVFLGSFQGGSSQKLGTLEIGCWGIAPEGYLSFADRILWDLPRAVLRALLCSIPKGDGDQLTSSEFVQTTDPRDIGPISPASLASLFSAMTLGLVRRLWRDLFRHELWAIGIAEAPIQRFLREGGRPKIKWLPARARNQYLADPFGIVRDGKRIVFAERFDHRRDKGWIVQIMLSDGPGDDPELTSLELETHLSYPFVFSDEGKLFGVPENFESGSISIYEVKVGKPSHWRKSGDLIADFPGIDSTLFFWDDHWWIFATDRDTGPDSHLYAWYASTLEGPWSPHAQNPIKIDIRSARPAGTPFIDQGRLIRPAQDCSQTYGGRVALNRIVRLDPEGFDEATVAWVEPDPRGEWPDGLHTLSHLGSMATLVDGKRITFSPWAMWSTVRRLAKKVVGL